MMVNLKAWDRTEPPSNIGVFGSLADDYLFDMALDIARSSECYHEQTVKDKELEAKLKAQKPLPKVKRILKNGDYMTVLWEDGDKTIVKRAEDEAESDYAAFTAALGIKCYGSNSALKRLVASAEVQGKKKKKEKKPAPQTNTVDTIAEILRNSIVEASGEVNEALNKINKALKNG